MNGDRRKGVPWTEEEHRLFLLGLAKFGKGDWRSIARNFVVSRTPTQVRASLLRAAVAVQCERRRHVVLAPGRAGGEAARAGAPQLRCGLAQCSAHDAVYPPGHAIEPEGTGALRAPSRDEVLVLWP